MTEQSKIHSRRSKVALSGFLLLLFSLRLSTARAQSVNTPIANLNNIRYASAFPGATAGAKIANCIADLPVSGGTCDARGLTGVQTISADPLAGVTNPVTILLGEATFTSVTWNFPIAARVSVRGSGPGHTLFIPAASNQVLFQMVQPTAGGIDNYYLGGFTVEAHASGSTGWAIDVAGFRTSTFENIEYLTNDNGTGNYTELFRLASWFGTSNTATLCYGNTLRHIYDDSQTGPIKLIWFTNDGLDSAGNPCTHSGISSPCPSTNFQANHNYIEDVWVDNVTGMSVAIDALRSEGVSVDRFFIEVSDSSGSGTWVMIPGTHSLLSRGYFEQDGSIGSNWTPIVNQAVANAGTSNGFTFSNNYAATPFTISIPTSSTAFNIFGNFPSLNLTVVDSSKSNLIQSGNQFLLYNSKGFYDFKNALSGGGDFGLRVDSTGGDWPGSLSIIDNNAGRARFLIFTNASSELASGASTSPALALVPFDNNNSSTHEFEVSNSSSLPQFWVDKQGSAYSNARFVSALNNLGTINTAPTFDASTANTFKATLGGNIASSTLSNSGIGQSLAFELCQDATGGRTFAWPSNLLGATNAIPAAASKCVEQDFIYDGSNLVSLGPATPVAVDLTAQSSSLSAASLTTPSANGLFKISYYLATTTAGTAGTVSVTFTWTDESKAETFTSSALSLSALGALAPQAPLVVYAKTTAPIQYSTTVSGATGSPQYSLHVRVEAL
jgi:hypothetical protein